MEFCFSTYHSKKLPFQLFSQKLLQKAGYFLEFEEYRRYVADALALSILFDAYVVGLSEGTICFSERH